MLSVRTLLGLILILAGGMSLNAQTSSSSGSSRLPGDRAFVRRISAGLTASFLPLKMMREGEVTSKITQPAIETIGNATSKAQWFSAGIVVQAALTDRFAVVANGLVRKSGYIQRTDRYVGTDNPNTTADERTLTTFTEDTRAIYLDFPVVLRRYSISRFSRGVRWFYEAGPAFRRVNKIRTSIATETSSSGTTCCDTTPAKPAHRTATGLTAGIGLQAVDDFGIRVIPEVRYTRWRNSTFDTLAARSRRDQVEIMVSITF